MASCHRNKLSWIWHEVLSAAQTSGSTAGLTCWPAWDERTIQVCHGSATIIYSRTADVQDLNHFLKYDQLQETVRKSWTDSPLQPQSQSFQLENYFNGELNLATSKDKNTLFFEGKQYVHQADHLDRTDAGCKAIYRRTKCCLWIQPCAARRDLLQVPKPPC